jgi:outer membrane protein W
VLAVAMVAVMTPAVASAQIHQVSSSSSEAKQTVNFSIGYFALKGLDSRDSEDVLLAELQNDQPLLFEVKDFNNATFGGEYLIGFGAFEAGVGLGYYQRSVPSVYAHLQHDDGTEIAQELKLKTIPVSFTARFLPLGRGRAVEPYIGAGITAIRWRFSETGEFVDDTFTIFPNRYIADGTSAGPTVLGGVRGLAGNFVVGGEVRWTKAEASGLLDDGFIGDKLDLGGWTTNFTFGFRF